MISHILDRIGLEQVVTSYREEELFIPSFKLIMWTREPGKLTWSFSKTFTTDEKFERCLLYFPVFGLPNASPVCDLVQMPNILLERNDKILIDYTLEWRYNDGEDLPITRRPAPGREIIIEQVLVA